MQLLFQFLFKYRIFILLVILESVCFLIIVRSNSFHRAKYTTSSNELSMNIADGANQVRDFVDLPNQNRLLAEENVKLRQQLLNLTDSSFMKYILSDSITMGVKAKVIDNSLFLRNNYLTINKGAQYGVKPGMGVVGPHGVVGQVANVTNGYATVFSVLHSRSMISSHHEPTGTLCSVSWSGEDPRFANLQFLPRHIPLLPGDSIATSGFNATYPPDQMIGVVSEVQLNDDATFYDAKIKLSTNFYNLSHVYLLDLRGLEQRDSLNVKITEQYERD